MNARFVVTDPGWLDALGGRAFDEVNFWRPGRQGVAEAPGTPWIFKVRGTDAVAGFAFFSYWTEMPFGIAWDTFGRANGVGSAAEFRSRVIALRRGDLEDDRVVCVVLSDPVVLPRSEWIAAPEDWKRNVVSGARYDITTGEGARVWDRLRALDAKSAMLPFSAQGGYATPQLVALRRGQGAFRFMVTDAYDRRCAVTGERTLPVLEAAHIRPFADRPEHDVRNGILLRSDVHKLYDLGFVTVGPDRVFRVSPALERDYSNGKIYYALDGKEVATPANAAARPDPGALEWHSKNVFRP